ncbi:hypothetical protein ACIA98_36770 [Streptomyces sp. NPDC051366]|uniref:hypothetical protein n=1 Tax=Streptomyces sp. NPDC051366 TaxID=3365652 RepID=UPI00379BB989
MRILRKLFRLPRPASPPTPPPVAPPAEYEVDDWMGESWIWEPGDLEEEADR